jgi:hypothetical protein
MPAARRCAAGAATASPAAALAATAAPDLAPTSHQRAPHLAEVARVVLVEQDAVVVLTTSITAAAGVLAVLANATVARADVPALLAVLPEACGGRSNGMSPAPAAGAPTQRGGPCMTPLPLSNTSSRARAANGAAAAVAWP